MNQFCFVFITSSPVGKLAPKTRYLAPPEVFIQALLARANLLLWKEITPSFPRNDHISSNSNFFFLSFFSFSFRWMDDTIPKNFPEIILMISSYYVNFNEGCHRSHPLNLRFSLCPRTCAIPGLCNPFWTQDAPHTRCLNIQLKELSKFTMQSKPRISWAQRVPCTSMCLKYMHKTRGQTYLSNLIRSGFVKNSYKDWIFLDFLFS